MGISHQLWVVDLDRIRSVWASRDETLLARLDAPEHRYTAALLEGRRDALIEVLVGGACDLREASEYQYAVEAICYELRSPVEPDVIVSAQMLVVLEDTLGVSFEPYAPIGEAWFVAVPDSEDFPFVGVVERAQVGALAEELVELRERAMAYVAAHPESEAAQTGGAEAVAHLALVYREAAERGLDVVAFQH